MVTIGRKRPLCWHLWTFNHKEGSRSIMKVDLAKWKG